MKLSISIWMQDRLNLPIQVFFMCLFFFSEDWIFVFSQVENVVSAEYELGYLLLEGHCFDVSTGQPPRGLQFTLGIKNHPVKVDTIVMANLVSAG